MLDFNKVYILSVIIEDFLLSSGMGSENHREYRGHGENNTSLCPPRALWLIFLTIIRVHPENIKKPLLPVKR
jgi:hypothetical protein